MANDSALQKEIKITADIMYKMEMATAIINYKRELFNAAFSHPKIDERELERARQEYIDAFSACLDIRIEGCKNLEDLNNQRQGEKK